MLAVGVVVVAVGVVVVALPIGCGHWSSVLVSYSNKILLTYE